MMDRFNESIEAAARADLETLVQDLKRKIYPEMDLFKKYIKEREGADLIANEVGFATFKIFGDVCYIIDIFVDKSCRQKGVASKLADEVVATAKGQGCKLLMGTVSLEVNDPTTSIKVLLAYGFHVKHFKDGLLVFEKEI